jgi:hypothetical protein
MNISLLRQLVPRASDSIESIREAISKISIEKALLENHRINVNATKYGMSTLFIATHHRHLDVVNLPWTTGLTRV